jgi:hypothetical protein
MTPLSSSIQPVHSPAWVVQTWLSFAIAVGATSVGIYHLPVDVWVRAFLGMGLLFSVGATFSLAKTVRDVHEHGRLYARIDEARVTKLLSEHDPVDPKLPVLR